jgi:polysaccharide export outer membrane protein
LWPIAAALLCLATLSEAAAQAPEYTIGPRDVIRVTIWGHDDLSKDYLVDPDGFLPFPLVGRVQAAGLTPKDLAVRLKELLEKDYLVNPQVIVSVKEYLSQKVQVFGEAERPGVFYLTRPTTLLDVLSQAGGVSKTAGKQVVVVRNARAREGAAAEAGSVILRLNLDKIRAGDASEDIRVLDGDRIFVSKVQAFFVLGEVKTAGTFPLDKETTVLEAITIAGGFSEKASPAGVKVIRRTPEGGQETQPLDLSGSVPKDHTFRIADGDTVLIPRRNTFFVFGEVKSAGAYQLDKDMNILEGITLAGGFTDRAGRSDVKVIRRKADGDRETFALDLSGSVPKDRAFQITDGDSVLVPKTQAAFFVLGEVKTAGTFPLEREVTVLEAVTIAGGFGERAWPAGVKIIRRTPDGSQETQPLDLSGSVPRDRTFRIADGDTVLVPRRNTFFVFGEVKLAGPYQLDKDLSILEGITLAGGFTDRAGRSDVKVIRRKADGERETFSLDLSGSVPKDRAFTITDGDSVLVPKTQATFLVMGEVKNPGTFPLDKSTSALEALGLAGGFSERGSPASVKIIRRTNGKEETFALDLSGQVPKDRDFKIQDGDSLIVPKGNTFFVFGQVKSPGAYQLSKATTILEGIIIAGGFTDKAAPGRTRIIRSTATGQEVINIDMNDVVKRGQPEKAIVLQENDVVVVPESFF